MARLHYLPASIWRWLSIDKWKFIQWNAGAINSQLLGRTTKAEQSIGERLRTRQNQRHKIKQAAQLYRIIGDVVLDRDVGAVERNYARLVPLLDKRQQMHASVTKINVHEIGPTLFQ